MGSTSRRTSASGPHWSWWMYRVWMVVFLHPSFCLSVWGVFLCAWSEGLFTITFQPTTGSEVQIVERRVWIIETMIILDTDTWSWECPFTGGQSWNKQQMMIILWDHLVCYLSASGLCNWHAKEMYRSWPINVSLGFLYRTCFRTRFLYPEQIWLASVGAYKFSACEPLAQSTGLVERPKAALNYFSHANKVLIG